MPLQILVDEEKCIGCGECAEICPKSAKIWKVGRVAHIGFKILSCLYNMCNEMSYRLY